jgi:hypothetical protein
MTDIIMRTRNNSSVDYARETKRQLLGESVLTRSVQHQQQKQPSHLNNKENDLNVLRYNNKHYTIDDVDFDTTPESTFIDSHGSEVRYVDYYRKHYDITIKDHKQPMLTSKPKKRNPREFSTCQVLLRPVLDSLDERCRGSGEAHLPRPRAVLPDRHQRGDQEQLRGGW